MKDGVIADFKVTEKMLNYFIQKAHNRKMLVHPRIVIWSAFRDHAGGKARGHGLRLSPLRPAKCTWWRQAMVAAIGAGLPITEPSGNMVVDYRWRDYRIAVISLSGIVYSRSVRMAGNQRWTESIHDS